MDNFNESFHANPYALRGMIRNHKLFSGRMRELREIASWLNTMQSVSVIGERRIGKSSLLYHIANPGPDHAELFSGIKAEYLDLQSVSTTAEFYFRACSLLGFDDGNSHWDLEEAVGGKRIVLCLDEFDQAYQKNFGDDFFNSLRSLAQGGNLALVVASRKPLNELHAIYLSNNDATSNFHNIFNFIQLSEFTPDEADAMVKAKREGRQFADEEIKFIRKLAGAHPYKLGLACSLTYAAKYSNDNSSKQLKPEDYKRIRRTYDVQTAGALKTASSVISDTASWMLAGILILIALPIVSFSANASFLPGMFIAALLCVISLWLLFRDFFARLSSRLFKSPGGRMQ